MRIAFFMGVLIGWMGRRVLSGFPGRCARVMSLSAGRRFFHLSHSGHLRDRGFMTVAVLMSFMNLRRGKPSVKRQDQKDDKGHGTERQDPLSILRIPAGSPIQQWNDEKKQKQHERAVQYPRH